MITIKYCKSMNEIVGIKDEKCYSFKGNTPKEIEMPTNLIKVLPFMRKTMWSDFVEMPYHEESEFTRTYLSSKDETFPRKLEIDPGIAIHYEYNEVGEPFFQLGCNIPKYVLNGIASLIKEQYYIDDAFKELSRLIFKYNKRYVFIDDKVLEYDEGYKYHREHPEVTGYYLTECPKIIPHIRIHCTQFSSEEIYIPCTEDNVQNIVKDVRRLSKTLNIEVEYFGIYTVKEVEDDSYTLATYYFTSLNNANHKSCEIWHSYISRNIKGIVCKL